MGRFLLIAVLLASAACKDKKSEGLPPAQEWGANTNTLPNVQQQGAANPHAGMGNNPHAGMGNNPHAGMDMGGGDPHAGMNMGSADPHAGAGAMAGMGGMAPDPNRKIDPTHRVAGVIKVHPKAKDRVPTGGVLFITVKVAGPDGAAVGPPLAVDKLTWGGTDLKFEMTEAQAMVQGTQLTGDVVVTVRYDNDGDASSKNPGDVVGTTKVKIPAENVTVLLDDILQ